MKRHDTSLASCLLHSGQPRDIEPFQIYVNGVAKVCVSLSHYMLRPNQSMHTCIPPRSLNTDLCRHVHVL